MSLPHPYYDVLTHGHFYFILTILLVISQPIRAFIIRRSLSLVTSVNIQAWNIWSSGQQFKVE